ncbi:hypothetical protein METBIDRAFT_76142 [Metschnikowia bicuspidata var. bicuspidata NRRL YB-4993]|uniref:CHY-type domain-containing protein n=1 Tax=Metschnikowia bicuspidata var. bicuspidata NRRL YB-4993 TaxID=869754 RepID=A0A1A0HG89_9ASCO|nr:hypothetical protein METBIDRAFT_76142 [Metschnikowia bicuspidata var. bicuspidata NRRL YB-4993]OBA23021.1 hypothetical protein METBIDRAFT_76142 [Metschnikowia bicuspidata var. bicuspidata NRRL YB-4993]
MPEIYGSIVDDKTRCAHYQLRLDIIALRFRCCDKYYPCYQCHEETSGHEIQRWLRSELDAGKPVVCCGECKAELTFSQYSGGGARCVGCGARFNPKCALHYDIYFDLS